MAQARAAAPHLSSDGSVTLQPPYVLLALGYLEGVRAEETKQAGVVRFITVAGILAGPASCSRRPSPVRVANAAAPGLPSRPYVLLNRVTTDLSPLRYRAGSLRDPRSGEHCASGLVPHPAAFTPHCTGAAYGAPP